MTMQHARRLQPFGGALDEMNESIHALDLHAGGEYVGSTGPYRAAGSDLHSDVPLINSNGVGVDDLDYDGVEVETGLREPPLLIRWEGYLMKRSDWLKHWETYYFVLHGRVLYCYLSEEEAKLHPENSRIKHGKFSFSDNLILDEVISVRSRLTYEFIFESDKGKQIFLRAKTEASKQMWMHMACHGIVDTDTNHDQVLHMRRAPQRHATLVDFFLGYEYLFASLSNIEDVATSATSSSSLDSSNKYRKSHTNNPNAPTIILPDAAISAFSPKVDHILCRFFSMCQTDIAMRNNYMPMVPFQGTFRGYAGLLEYFTKLSKAVAFRSFTVEGMSFEGEGAKRLVVVQGQETMQVRGTGQMLSQAWVHKFLVKDDGRIYRWEINGDIVASSVAFKHLHSRGGLGAEKFRETFATIKLDSIPNLARKERPAPQPPIAHPPHGADPQQPTRNQPKMAWNTPPEHWLPPEPKHQDSKASTGQTQTQSVDRLRTQTQSLDRSKNQTTPLPPASIHVQLKRTQPASPPVIDVLSPTAQSDDGHSPFEDRLSTFLENERLSDDDEPEHEDRPNYEQPQATPAQFQGTSQPKESFLSNASSFQDDVFSATATAATTANPVDSHSFPNSPPQSTTATNVRPSSASMPPPDKPAFRGSHSFNPSPSQASPPPFPHYAPHPPNQSSSYSAPSHPFQYNDMLPSNASHSNLRYSSGGPPNPSTSSRGGGGYFAPSPDISAYSSYASDGAITSSSSFDYPLGFKRGNLWPDAPVPPSENVRLQAVKRLDLCRPRDDLAMYLNIACKTLRVPMGTVCVVGGAAGLFVAKVGMMQVDTVPRDVIFESHVIMSAEPTVVLDTSLDIRFAMNPLVTQGDVGFYIGIPLVTADNVVVGAVSLVDKVPRGVVRQKDLSTLVQIAQTIMHRVEDLSAAATKQPSGKQHTSEAFERRKQMDLEVD